jgi:Uma2 family endonuclease
MLGAVDPGRKRATVDDLLALPPDARAELVEGAIVHLPPPLPEQGVAFYWILDPAGRVLEAFELPGGGWLRIGAWIPGQSARIRPFEAVELEVGRLFPPD